MIRRPRNLAVLVVLVALSAGALAVGAVMLYLKSDRGEWTSTSPAAVEQLEAGIDDMTKLYWPDAAGHFARALELDEGFVAAKVFALYVAQGDEERREALLAELGEVDVRRLRPNERFLVEYHVARGRGEDEASREILDRYLATHPDDPFAQGTRCGRAWQAQDWDTAEACYAKLLARHPNQVQAQNNLGYIAMAQGRFSEAEEHFRTYRFIAPDQANPYDSLGQLLIVLGRYDEAEELLRQALEVKPDFCATWDSLGRLYVFWGKPDELREVADGMEASGAGCPSYEAARVPCRYRAWADLIEGDRDAAYERLIGECTGGEEPFDLLAHRLALERGDEERVRRLEAEVAKEVEKAAGRPVQQRHYEAIQAYLDGLRALHAGRPAEAAKLLAEADEKLDYWGERHAVFKLMNRLYLAHALAAAGDATGAEAVSRKLAAVNPEVLTTPHLVALARRAVERGRP